MDIQLKRGILEICVLAVLENGDSYGYQMIKDISPRVAISESTLYPILKRLELAKALTVYQIEHGGRLRKYYKITDTGRKKLAEFKEKWKELTAVYRWITDMKRGENS